MKIATKKSAARGVVAFAAKIIAGMVLYVLLLSVVLSPAYAFEDVTSESPYHDGITYCVNEGIMLCMDGEKFGADEILTEQELNEILDRIQPDLSLIENYISATSQREYPRWWFYQRLFNVFRVPIYDAVLYDFGRFTKVQNVMYAAEYFRLCPFGADPYVGITRGEAANAFYRVLSGNLAMPMPEIGKKVEIRNVDGAALNLYLRELDDLPEAIVDAFAEDEWTFVIDKDYLFDYTAQRRVEDPDSSEVAGLCDSEQKKIYVNIPYVTWHEFGHFLDEQQGWISYELEDEIDEGLEFLRAYAGTNCLEYYACYFAYYLRFSDSEACCEMMERLTPKTYEHFRTLENNGWKVA